MISQTAPDSTPSSLLRIGIPEVWVRFLVAIVGLVLAFAAALFSTVSRESGNVWGTICSRLGGAPAGYICWPDHRAIPGAARGGGALREAMDYDVTRAGMIYILFSRRPRNRGHQ